MTEEYQAAVVYRAIDPSVVATFRAWGENKARTVEQVNALCEECFPGSRPAGRTGPRGQSFVGIIWDPSDPVPDGWRMLPGRGVPAIFPKKTTNVGKALAARFDALFVPDPEFPGMLREWWRPADGSYKVHYPAARLLGDDLFVWWSVDFERSGLDEDGMGHQVASAVDPARWERVKLSEWHARIEAEDGIEVSVG